MVINRDVVWPTASRSYHGDLYFVRVRPCPMCHPDGDLSYPFCFRVRCVNRTIPPDGNSSPLSRRRALRSPERPSHGAAPETTRSYASCVSPRATQLPPLRSRRRDERAAAVAARRLALPRPREGRSCFRFTRPLWSRRSHLSGRRASRC